MPSDRRRQVWHTRILVGSGDTKRCSSSRLPNAYAYAALCGLLHAIGPKLNAIAAHVAPARGELAPEPDDVAPLPDAPEPQSAPPPPPAAAPPAQPKPPASAPAQKSMTRQERLRALVRRMA